MSTDAIALNDAALVVQPRSKRKKRKKRPAGTGSIYLDPRSSVYQMKLHVRGVPIRRSTGTRNRLEAEAILRAELRKVATGRFIPPNVERTTIAQLFEGLVRDYKINGRKSLPDAEARWRLHLEPIFGSLREVDVTSDRLNCYVEQRQMEGATIGTINRELSCLRRAFAIAAASEPPKVARVPKFPRFREHNIRTGFVEEAQYEKLATACTGEGLWMRALFETGFVLGWRDDELKRLRVSQVDLAARSLRLEPDMTKNAEGRTAVMPAKLYVLIQQCVTGKQPSDHVFTRDDGGPVRDFRGAWHKVCCAVGLGQMLCKACSVPIHDGNCPHCGRERSLKEQTYRGLIFHDLRRTAVRNMVRNGIPEKVAMTISGHKTRSVFDRYNIVSMGDLSDAAAKLDRRDRERTAETPLGRVWAESAPSPVQLPQPN